jgi:DNA-binding CsgD family transcriptional regulator
LFTPRPLGPLLDIAAEIGGELERVIDEGKPHEVATALMGELAAGATALVVLEDLQWADEATLDVLRLVCRRIAAIPALLVATYRDDGLDRSHPLRLMLGDIGTGLRAARFEVKPLSPQAVALLASARNVDAEELYRKTSGNPFFVTEALAAPGLPIPNTVRDAVLARVARLGEGAKELLEAVAVVPPRAELWLLDRLAPGAVDRLEECVSSGMLTTGRGFVAFRHELARLAVEESLPPHRSLDLHKKTLAALTTVEASVVDLARLAHHAEAAGDADALLRFAPAAAVEAASLGAHREAAAQWARALRFGECLAPADRAKLLESRAVELHLTDDNPEAVDAATAALQQYRDLGDKLSEGDMLRLRSGMLWCLGRRAECERDAEQAVSTLEALPPGRELGLAYANFAWFVCQVSERMEEAIAWATRALELGRRLADDEIVVKSLTIIGGAEVFAGAPEGIARLDHALALAETAGLDAQAGMVYINFAAAAMVTRNYALHKRCLAAGIDYCSARGLELHRLNLLAFSARIALDRGRWAEAVDSASAVARAANETTPRITALVVRALVRARRGDPEVWGLVDEAWALAEPTGELPRIGPVAAARAEAAWLEGRHDVIGEITKAPLDLAVRRASSWRIGELAYWRWQAGIREKIPAGTAEPFSLQLRGEWRRAAELWTQIGCPYEAALALADGDEAAARQSLEELQALGARAAANIVARRLRARGAKGLPRGPRPTTSRNPANLTTRELEVLELLAHHGLRNAEIARRLFVTEKTVGHHVSAILRKLGVQSRAQAAAEAVRLGIVTQDR